VLIPFLLYRFRLKIFR